MRGRFSVPCFDATCPDQCVLRIVRLVCVGMPEGLHPGQLGWLTAATTARSPLRVARRRRSSASATSHHHPAASQRVLADQQGGQPAQVLQFLVKCRREGVYRDVVRTGPVVFLDALSH
jgi:hypothetical protein